MSWPDHPEVKWASKYQSPTRMRWKLQKFSQHCGKSPTELLELQSAALKSEDLDQRYVVMQLLQEWVDSLKGRRRSKTSLLSAVRNFFDYYHRPLPPTDRIWLRNLKSDTGEVEGKLSQDVAHAILMSIQGDPRKLSIFMTQLQSFSGPRELCIIGNELGVKLGQQIRAGEQFIELYFSKGRKQSDTPWYSYLGKDACTSLHAWFEVRGYPTLKDPYVWPSIKAQTRGGPLTPRAIYHSFKRTTMRLGLRPRDGNGRNQYTRYGISVKEFRDLASSLAQKAVGTKNERGEAFLESSIEYFLGHIVDPLNYRKIHKLDPDFRKRQYMIAEPYLNLLSSRPGVPELSEDAMMDRLAKSPRFREIILSFFAKEESEAGR